MTATTAPPTPNVPTWPSGPGPDRYSATLRQLDAATDAWHAALAAAHRAAPAGQSASLVELHNRVRDMGHLLNQALGGWPDPTQAKESP